MYSSDVPVASVHAPESPHARCRSLTSLHHQPALSITKVNHKKGVQFIASLETEVAAFSALARAKKIFLLRNTRLGSEKKRSMKVQEQFNVVKFPAPEPTKRVVKRCRERLRNRKPSYKLRGVLQSPARPSTPSQKPPRRAALLAHQALQTSVLQTYTRCYLYRCWYRGGLPQLVTAVHLAARSRRSRAFRHWRRVVTQRAKLRLCCGRAERRIDRTADSWARFKAAAVVEEEGKYAGHFDLVSISEKKGYAMASPPTPSVGATCVRSIVTLDGYVSRGRSPARSVPSDHAMLQDFSMYLELRLKCQNMDMLRRIFADFLNEHENTLAPMLRLGCTIITIYPVLRTRARRLEQAAKLLAKPKSYLDERGCVFLYLQYRAATRNMALLKHLFLEFVNKRETALLEFVGRGCQVISVIPFELPRMAPPVRSAPQPQQQEAAVEQQRGAEGGRRKRKKKRKGSPTVVANAASAAEGPPKRLRCRARGEPAVATRRGERIADGAASAHDKGGPPSLSPAAVSAPRRGRKPKPNALPEATAAEDADAGQDETAPPASTPRRSGEPEAGAVRAAPAADDSTHKQAKQAKAPTDDRLPEKSHKRGKPVMSEEMCRRQLALRGKMEKFEEQIPWEAVFGTLRAPFDEVQHPALSRKFRMFWRKHARAVWERNFWSPLSRKLCLQVSNKRNNRQLTAKHAFESLLISVYQELGAQFFVDLDAQQPPHPGWWYRGPVVALFALEQLKDEAAVWEYVKSEALERFPDCKLPVPLRFHNCSAQRKHHSQASKSMWMVNHELAPKILGEIAELKAGRRGREQTVRRKTK